MKKSLAILLFALLILPFVGSYFLIHVKKTQIRKEVKALIEAGIGEKDLLILKFTREETETRLNWKHSLEFVLDGKMYDIVDQWVEDEFIVYKCYEDHKETRLNLQKTRIMAKALGQDPAQKKHAERIKSFFNTVFSQDAFTWKPISDLQAIFRFSFFVFRFSSIRLTPPVPPPKYF